MTQQVPKVLTFDVVGTLIDFEAGMLAYLRQACGSAVEALDDDTLLEAYRDTRADDAAIRFPDDLERIYPKIAAQYGLPQSAAVAAGFRESVREWPAFPDSVATLKRLRKHFKLVAMTNAQRWALNQMERTLDFPFDETFTIDDALYEKPDPMYFAFVRGRLSREGHGLHDILHVAQSQYHDIGVAKRLGYTVCWIERRQGMKGTGGTIKAPRTEPHYHYATLAEFADAVDADRIHMVPGPLPGRRANPPEQAGAAA